MILFPKKWSESPIPEYRTGLLDSPSLLRPLQVKDALRHAAKTTDCVRQLNDASATWEANEGKYLFVFCRERNEEGLQKVTVWAKKKAGVYLRLKTVWVRNEDYIFEALPYFAAEYFEMDLPMREMITDVEFFHCIDMTLQMLSKDCPSHLKKKERFIKDWAAYMPKFLDMLADLDQRVDAKANPPRKTASSSQRNLDSLLAEGRPIDINELRDAIWNAEYSDPLFTAADQILFDLEHRKDTEEKETDDQALLEAAVAYDCRMGVQDCLKAKPTKINRHNRLVDWANRLTAIWKNRPPTENEMRAMNATTPLHDFFSAIDNQAAAKVSAKNLRIMAESIRRYKASQSLGMLEVLVNARTICRRMPQELSSWIKDTFENDINPKAGWEKIMDEASLRDRLRRLSIQSRVLEYLRYDVEMSYTGNAMHKERGEIFFSKDSESHLIFSRLLNDFNWKFATADYLRRYAAKLNEHASAATEPANILNYATALLNVRLRQGVDIFAPLPPSSGEADSTPETESSPAPERSSEPAAATETDVLKSAPNEWTEKAAECAEKIFLEGSDVVTYCRENGLPYAEFNAYFETLMDKVADVGKAHENAIKTDPEYRRKEIALWQKRKDELFEEMTEVSDRLGKILDELDRVKLRLAELNALP